ncbi:MAG TPA: serine/threonine-protein kinase [Roseiflexaceae bacterium]|nr:serine/threonine-protein kinase [Roseiflexaceae bacterium]
MGLRRLFKRGTKATRSTAQLGREFSVGDVLEQRFDIESVRRGYMGVVYIAYDRQRRQRVVLKTFQNKFLWDEEAIARFNAEAELWMRLGSHPNIVRALDLRTFLGKPHVVAEYVHGGPLRALVGHLKLQETLEYAIQVCWGMQYAVDHAAIMHRDLKPDNILVTLDGQVKVTDFGLSRVLPTWQWAEHLRDRRSVAMRIRSMPDSEALGGTLPYMAPELFDGAGTPGVWTDIYAFGVTLYELLTGKLPFDSMRDESLIRMHIRAAPRDPRQIKAGIHEGAVRIVMKCLAKRPFERYQSFSEVERELQALRKEIAGEYYEVTWPEDNREECERWNEQGLAHMKLGEHSDALRCFNYAVELDRNRADCWLNLATARLRLWQYHEALQAVEEGLRRAVSRNEYGQLYGVRGEIFTTLGMLDRALPAIDQGLSYTPNAPRLWLDKAALLQRGGMLREAQECLERALKFDALDPEAHRMLGDVLRDQGRHRQAAAAYTDALRLDPRSALSWARYGHALLRIARPKEALRAFEMALKLDPEHAEALAGERQARKELGR